MGDQKTERSSAGSAFCENCREQREIILVEEQETLEVDGVSYTYPVRAGYCTTCGERATPQEVLEANQRAFSTVVRERFGVVSQDVVEGLVSRYNIKPRPLSSLLGWGTHTYPRFMEGDIPSKPFSDRIKALWSSPLSYLMLLLDSGESISNVALKKSEVAAREALSTISPKFERVCAYLIGKTESNSSLALQKELYYAQGLMMAFFGKELIQNACEAWQLGPVFPDVWRTIHPRDIREEALVGAGLHDCVRGTFTSEELLVLDAVASRVGCYSPYVLKDITHGEKPWLDARGGIPASEPSNNPITERAMQSFFDELRVSYGMEEPSDIGRYIDDMARKERE